MAEPLFTADEVRRNAQYRQEGLELIASGEAIGFVGAGLGIALGYPSWTGFGEKLAILANDIGSFVAPAGCTPTQAPEYAEAIKQFILGETGSLDQYWAFLGREFDQRDPAFTQLQCDLMRLPLRGFITSNFEPSLECACAHVFPGHDPFSITIHQEHAHLVSKFLIRLSQKSDAGPGIAHLHGSYKDPKYMVVAASDYTEAYGLREPTEGPRESSPSWPLRRRLLWALLASRRLIFFGFSMNDVDFQVMLASVASDLWNWDQSIHYAVMAIDASDPDATKKRAEQIHRKFGVRVIFYENNDGSHAGLNAFMADALAFSETSGHRGYLEAINRRTDRLVRPYED
jgi:hypothetical protein